MDVLAIVRLLDAIVSLSLAAGISIEKYRAMRDAAGGELTDEQIKQLADDAQNAIDQL